jgi:hypothetical protein
MLDKLSHLDALDAAGIQIAAIAFDRCDDYRMFMSQALQPLRLDPVQSANGGKARLVGRRL